MVCVSGGLLAFGSSLYPSYSFSKFDPPWKKHIPPDHADAGGEGSTKKVDGSARGVDTGEFETAKDSGSIVFHDMLLDEHKITTRHSTVL